MNQVEIVNNALLLIGENTIADINEANNRAKTARNLWDRVRDGLLEMYPWHFARKRVSLARLATTPAYGYAYEYQLPTDLINIVDEGGTESVDTSGVKWVIEGDRLRTDATSVSITYVARITDTSLYSSAFSKLLAYALAIEMILPLAGNRPGSELMNGYQSALIQAKAAEKLRQRVATQDTLINVRSL